MNSSVAFTREEFLRHYSAYTEEVWKFYEQHVAAPRLERAAFQKAMDLVLENLVKNRVPVGEEPENIIVLTDMAFDKACGSSEISSNSYTYNVKTSNWQTHIEMIRENFKKIGETMWGIGKGYKVPRIVIWNLSSYLANDFHAKEDSEGVIMLSGWSPSMFKVIVEKGIVINTPLSALRYILDDPMYDLVREGLKKK